MMGAPENDPRVCPLEEQPCARCGANVLRPVGSTERVVCANCSSRYGPLRIAPDGALEGTLPCGHASSDLATAWAGQGFGPIHCIPCSGMATSMRLGPELAESMRRTLRHLIPQPELCALAADEELPPRVVALPPATWHRLGLVLHKVPELFPAEDRAVGVLVERALRRMVPVSAALQAATHGCVDAVEPGPGGGLPGRVWQRLREVLNP